MRSNRRAPGPAPVVPENVGRLSLGQELLVDPRLFTFAAWFAPGLTPHENPYQGRTFFDRPEDALRDRERGWKAVRGPINLWRALLAHVAAGTWQEDQTFRDDGPEADRSLCALGLLYDDAARTRLLNLDVDGAFYDAGDLVAALGRGLGDGRFLLLSGSGKPGKFRVLVPIVPVSVGELRELAGALLEAIGFPPRPGGVEVYPSATNGRVPFGMGGCTLFPGVDGPGVHHHPYALLERLCALQPVDLAEVVTRLTGESAPAGLTPSPRSRRRIGGYPGMDLLTTLVGGSLTSVEHPTGDAAAPASPSSLTLSISSTPSATSSVTTSLTPATPTTPATPRPQKSWRRVRPADSWHAEAHLAALVVDPAPDAGARPEKSTRCPWAWIRGVTGEGERYHWRYVVIKDGFYRGRSQRRNVACVQARIAQGGIARSRAAKQGKLHRELADVAKVVARVYATHPKGRPPPVHLSVREIVDAHEIAERRSKVTGVPARLIGRLLFDMLPKFKGAAWAGRKGLEDLLVHWTEWEAAGGHDYAAVRTAAGIFEWTTGFLSQASLRACGRNPADAHARKWAVRGFRFDEPDKAPRRAVGRSYGAATLAAQHVQARTARRAEGRLPALAGTAIEVPRGVGIPLAGVAPATLRRDTGSRHLTPGMQRFGRSAPGPAAPRPTAPQDPLVAGQIPAPPATGEIPQPSPPLPENTPPRRPEQIPLRLVQQAHQEPRQQASPAPPGAHLASWRRGPLRARRRPRRAHDPDP